MSEMLRGIPFDYEPTRENRFFLEFPSELGIEVWQVQEVKRPSIKINIVEVNYLNLQEYVAGRMTCDEMDVVLIGLIGPSTSQQVMEWVRLHGEFLTGRMGYNSAMSKTLRLKELDPTGVPISCWELQRCILSNVDMGKNSQDSDDIQKITLTLRPTKCIQLF